MEFDEELIPFAFTASSSSSSSSSPPSALSAASELASESAADTSLTGLRAPWISPRMFSHSAEDLSILRRSIVCFYADDRFTEMAVVAVTTLLKCTPGISVGVLAPSNRIAEMITRQVRVEDLDRVHRRVASAKPFFRNWNPTQYKLDIVQFCDTKRFDFVYWMDSDTLTYEDISDKLIEFVKSPSCFLMTPDHVNYDQQFCKLWLEQHGNEAPIIPQSCFMGFKTIILESFFNAWRDEWSEWITPYAFANRPDPRPHFVGSAFCAEQYALGVALAKYCKEHEMEFENPVMWFTRQSVAIPKLPGDAKPCYMENNGEEGEDQVSPSTKGPDFVDGKDGAADEDGKPGGKSSKRSRNSRKMDRSDLSSVFIVKDPKEADPNSDGEKRSVFKKLIRRRNSGSLEQGNKRSQISFAKTPSDSYPRPQQRVSCASSLYYNGSLSRCWVSYPVESESGSSPSSMSSTSQTSEDGAAGSLPSLEDKSPPPGDQSCVRLVSSSNGISGAPTFAVVSVRGDNLYPLINTSQSFPFVPYSISFSEASLASTGQSVCFCHNKLLMSQVPALILADGRTELGNTDATNGGRSAIIDKFFGFFHYYHQNQRSMLSWWRESLKSSQYVLCPCVRSPTQPQTQFPID